MRFVVAAAGSRGEGEPLIALCTQLQRHGHDVTFIGMEDFQSQAHAFGINYHKVGGSLQSYMQAPENRGIWEGDADAVKKYNQTFWMPAYRGMLEAVWQEAQHADVLILNSGFRPAQKAGELLGIPTFISCASPGLSPTKHFPHLLAPKFKPGFLFNKLSYAVNRLYPADDYAVISDWYRETLGVAPPKRYDNYLKLNGRRLPILYFYSEELFPSPPDWDDSVCVCGYWWLPMDPTWEPPPALLDFLQSDARLVCVTFGSAIGPHPERTTEVVAETIRRLPYRFLVCGGWGGLSNDNLPEGSLFIEAAPFQWLFQHVDLVVHHGGAGVLSQTLKLGKPSVICPAGADHPFWAAAAHRKGVAPPYRMHNELTADWLVDSIRSALSTPSISRAAAELGGKLREEDSFGKTISFIERKVETWHTEYQRPAVRRDHIEQQT